MTSGCLGMHWLFAICQQGLVRREGPWSWINVYFQILDSVPLSGIHKLQPGFGTEMLYPLAR